MSYKKNPKNKNEESSIPIMFCPETWWRENGAIVIHALTGGKFRPSHETDQTATTDGRILPKENLEPSILISKSSKVNNNDDNMNDKSSNQSVFVPPTLEQFQKVYHPKAMYEDLFIIAKGLHAVQYSFEIIGTFWNIQLLQIGPPRIVKVHPSRFSTAATTITSPTSSVSLPTSNSLSSSSSNQLDRRYPNHADTASILLRVPYTIAQSPKHFPLNVLFFQPYQYSGWIDLHLQFQKNDTSDTAKKDGSLRLKDRQNPWKVVNHCDCMALWTKDDGTKDGHQLDYLTYINGIVVIGSLMQGFRRTHGIALEYFAEKAYGQKSKP